MAQIENPIKTFLTNGQIRQVQMTAIKLPHLFERNLIATSSMQKHTTAKLSKPFFFFFKFLFVVTDSSGQNAKIGNSVRHVALRNHRLIQQPAHVICGIPSWKFKFLAKSLTSFTTCSWHLRVARLQQNAQ